MVTLLGKCNFYQPLVEQGADVNYCYLEYEKKEVLDKKTQKMELVDDTSKIRCFTIPLIYNIYQNSEEMIELSLKAGADPN